MSVENQQITAAVAGHWLVGRLPLTGSRIQEALSDPSSDFVKLLDVEVHPLAKRECVAKLREVLVPKSKIEFVAVPSGPHEAPEKRWNNRTAKQIVQAFAIVSDYSISGELHLPAKPGDFQLAFTRQLGRFFALTGVTLNSSRQGTKQLSVSLVIVNKDFVSCFQVGQPAPAEGSGTGLQTLLYRDDSMPCDADGVARLMAALE